MFHQASPLVLALRSSKHISNRNARPSKFVSASVNLGHVKSFVVSMNEHVLFFFL